MVRFPDDRPGAAGALGGRAPALKEPAGSARTLRDSDRRILVRLGDAAAAACAMAGALLIRSAMQGAPFTPAFVAERAVWFVLAAAWILLLLPAQRPGVLFSPRATAAAAARAVVTVTVLYVLIFFLAPRGALPRLVVLYFLALAFLTTVAWRFVYVYASTRPSRRVPVAIVGAGAAARRIADVLRAAMPHKHVLAFVGERGPAAEPDAVRPAIVDVDGLKRLLTGRQVAELVLAHDGPLPPALIRVIVHARERKVPVAQMTDVYERLLNRIPIRHLAADTAVAADGNAGGDAFRIAKRALDVAAGGLGCAACLLLLPVLGSAVWLNLGSPILYRQQRVGRDGRRFELLKLRTMGRDAERDGPQWARARDPRLGRLGRFLRRFHLDELPQFWNVLKGEMSLVGPRPERPEFVDELERAIPFYRERLVVRPGLTGWAQVNQPYGRSLEDAATKLEYDLYYVKHCSLLLDLRIAASTAAAVLALDRR